MSIYRRFGGKRPAALVHTTGVEASKQSSKQAKIMVAGARRVVHRRRQHEAWASPWAADSARWTLVVVVLWILCNIGSEGVVASITSNGIASHGLSRLSVSSA